MTDLTEEHASERSISKRIRYPRFGIRTLLLAATIAAVALALCLPFIPTVEMDPLVRIPRAESRPAFRGGHDQYRLTIRNDSRYSCWIADNELPIVVAPRSGKQTTSKPLWLSISIVADQMIQLSPGEQADFNVHLPRGCDRIQLMVFARDWRGRTGHRDFGVIELASDRSVLENITETP